MRFRDKNLLVFFILLSISIAGFLFTKATSNAKETADDNIKIITSFYPMYIAALNITANAENIELVNLTQPQTGCLHDYQLTPNDMVAFENADIFIINGGGMESFIEDIFNSYPDMDLIDASNNIEMLISDEDSHEDGHQHSQYNAHLWMSIPKYMQQLKNIKDGLIKFNPQNRDLYENNYRDYILKLESLNQDMHNKLKDIRNRDIIIFHDSFQYLANEFGLDVKHTVVMEQDTSLSAGEIAEIVDEIGRYNIKVMFTESQYSKQISSAIANETSAKVYTLDSCVNGIMNRDSYLEAMKRNLKIMEEALN